MHIDQKCWILKHFAAIINIVNPGTVCGFFQCLLKERSIANFERKVHI